MSRILVEASPVVNTRKSGVGYYVEGLIKSLAASNDEVIGYYFNFLSLNKESLLDVKAIHFRRIWLIPGKVLSLTRRFGVQPPLELFTSTRADYVIFTNYVSLPLINKKIKKILIVYDLSFLDCPQYVQDINLNYLKSFCPPSIRSADLIITISEFTKSRIKHYFPDIKIPIIVTPIPPYKNQPSLSSSKAKTNKWGLKKGHFILYIGTIEPRKNLQNLIKAYRLLDDSIQKEYPLVLAGGKGWKDNEIRNDIEEARREGLTIITPGYISEEEKSYLYQQANCFIMPSYYEGFGMPILEAMSYSLPIAVSDIAVFKEVAGDAVIYFKPNNPKDIKLKIQQLIEDQTLRIKLKTDGLRRLNSYSWQENLNLIIESLKGLN